MDWKKPVQEYIPEFRLHDAVATDRVTVRDLLCHHSGLPRHDWIWLPGDLSPAHSVAQDKLARKPTGQRCWCWGRSSKPIFHRKSTPIVPGEMPSKQS